MDRATVGDAGGGPTSVDVAHVAEVLAPRRGVRQGFATCAFDDVPVGVTYGAVEDAWLGLYCVVTDPTVRRRGIGRTTIHAVLA